MTKTDSTKAATYSQVALPEELIKKIDMFCEITGRSKEDAVIRALDDYISPYLPTDGKEPVKAMYKQSEGEEAVPCYVVDDQSDLTFMPGYRIVVDGRLLRVTKDCIEMQEDA